MSCPDKSNLDLANGDDVIIVGKVTSITHPAGADYCAVTVQYTLNGATVTKTFHSNELVKGFIEGNDIHGALEIPT